MSFIKRFIYGSVALIFILMGGFGTQSNSMILQCGGFIGLILGLVILYVFARMAWRAMGCLPSLLVFVLITLFVLYAIGSFNGGINNIGHNLKSFFGQHNESSSENIINPQIDMPEIIDVEDVESENTSKNNNNDGVVNLIGEDEHPIILENFLPKPKKKEKRQFNPMDYPYINGYSNVVQGDTLTVAGRVVKLFGVASPEISQTCADGSGRGYRCGQQSIAWLSSWLSNHQVKCHIIAEDKSGLLTGVCMLGQYDIGAAIVNAGWAVADTRQTAIYSAYQNQAALNKRGLWQGKFYMPWDWQKIKNRKANIKVIKPKVPKKSVWSKYF